MNQNLPSIVTRHWYDDQLEFRLKPRRRVNNLENPPRVPGKERVNNLENPPSVARRERELETDRGRDHTLYACTIFYITVMMSVKKPPLGIKPAHVAK